MSGGSLALSLVMMAAAQADTSSTAVPFPEEGYPLRRAPMPEGRAPDGFDRPTVRPTPERGTQDGLRRAPMPEGRAPDGMSGPLTSPSPPSSPKAAVDDGVYQNPSRPPAGSSRGSAYGTEGAAESDVPKRKFGDFADGLTRDYGIKIRWNGYVRMILEAIENDERSEFIGRNDGFKLANARLGLRAGTGNFYTYISVDAAAGERETFNDPNQELAVRPRDMFLRYRLAEFASITVGRFKAPYDLGQLEATAFRVFIDLPLESRGVLPTQGLQVEGMGQGRQLGAMIHRDRLGLDPDGFDLGYALALTNGRTLGLAFNDNDRVAAFGRVSAYWADVFQLNLAGFLDNRTVGTLPDLFDEDVRGAEVSALIQAGGFSLEGQFLYHHIGFDAPGRPNVEAIGAHGQLAYAYGGFQVAYRFAYYDPINTDDSVTEHTAGLAYSAPALPLRFILNGTLAVEDSSIRVDNNRLAFLTQFIF